MYRISVPISSLQFPSPAACRSPRLNRFLHCMNCQSLQKYISPLNVSSTVKISPPTSLWGFLNFHVKIPSYYFENTSANDWYILRLTCFVITNNHNDQTLPMYCVLFVSAISLALAFSRKLWLNAMMRMAWIFLNVSLRCTLASSSSLCLTWHEWHHYL